MKRVHYQPFDKLPALCGGVFIGPLLTQDSCKVTCGDCILQLSKNTELALTVGARCSVRDKTMGRPRGHEVYMKQDGSTFCRACGAVLSGPTR